MSSSYSYPGQHKSLRLKSILREPLLHFLIVGGVLFAAYAWLNRGVVNMAPDAGREVHVTAQQIDWLKETWSRQWQRQPDDRELKQLVSDYLREELLAREALSLGLDNGDTIVRRRLAQKMEFLVQGTARVANPTEEQLRRFFDANRDQFQTPAQVSFAQVFVNRKKRGDAAVSDAREILWQLLEGRAPAAVAQLGDPSLLPEGYIAQEEQSITTQFGPDFARAVFAAEPGKWFGPIESGYGLHLVRVTEKVVPKPKEFEEVRNAVVALSLDQQQRAGEEQFYAALMKRYKVVFDQSVRPLFEPGALVEEVRR